MHNNNIKVANFVLYLTQLQIAFGFFFFFWGGGDRYSKYAVRKHSGEITAYGKEINTRKKEIHVEI